MYITTNLKEALTISFVIVIWICIGLKVNDIRLIIKNRKKNRK